MKIYLLFFLLLLNCYRIIAQPAKIELYDLVRKLSVDSTGFENVGDWAIAGPKKFPVKWKSDKLEMSTDTSINFYRLGTADLTIRHHSFMQAGQPVGWQLMLKGPRAGYSSFSIISTPSAQLRPGWNIDSLFGTTSFQANLIKSCNNTLNGYYYYELKLPRKDIVYFKISWLLLNGNTIIRIDGYDSWSRYLVKLDCR